MNGPTRPDGWRAPQGGRYQAIQLAAGILGVSGRDMVEALIGGEHDLHVLAGLARFNKLAREREQSSMRPQPSPDKP